jgi:hypothetical protein
MAPQLSLKASQASLCHNIFFHVLGGGVSGTEAYIFPVPHLVDKLDKI